MKTKSFLIAALLIVSAVVSSVAGDEPGSKGFAIMTTKGSEVFKVVYKAEVAGKVKLNLYDAQGILLFTENFSAEGFILPLNFQGLKYGEYSVELIDASGRKTETISYQPAAETKFFQVRKLANSSDKFMVSVMGANEGEKINVKIYDSFSNLIHTEVKEVNGQFAQVYNLKNSNGSVTFEISDNAGKTSVVSF